MLDLVMTSKFEKDLLLMKKRGKNIEILKNLVKRLCAEETLEAKYHVHKLVGNYHGFYECHVEPDWLLVYGIDKGQCVLVASRTGTHSDLKM